MFFASISMSFVPPEAPAHILSILGIFWMSFGMGFANAATYKWIPKICPKIKAPVGGIVGGLGAFGGFVFPLMTTPITTSGDGVENFAKGIYIWTVIAFILIILNTGLWIWSE